jgi:hypothetical protein
LVTGSAALLKGINPSLSAPELKHLLIDGAEARINFLDTWLLSTFFGKAETPNLLLNVGNSARAAKLTRDSGDIKSLPAIDLAKGQSKTVSFDVLVPSTGVKALDVVFLVDVSGSYGDDIATLKTQASAIIDNLTSRGIDVQFGVSAFADFPLNPYGGGADYAFMRLTRITSDKATVLAGINALTLGWGNDEAESQLEALYQVATGTGRDINGDGIYTTASGDVMPQPMGFRPGASKVVLFATDAPFHDRDADAAYPGAGLAATVSALKAQGIRVIALQSGTTTSAAADIGRLVTEVGGTTYQLSTNSADIAQAIAAGIDATLAEVDVSLEKISGAEWISAVTQDKMKARPGEKVSFTVTLEGRRASSVGDLTYDMYLWARGNAGLLQRVKIPVRVPKG